MLPTLLGVGTVFAYRRFLREADELRRKIELDALAMSVGAGLVGGVALWLFERAGAISESDVLYVTTLMAVTHVGAVLVGQRRYA